MKKLTLKRAKVLLAFWIVVFPLDFIVAATFVFFGAIDSRWQLVALFAVATTVIAWHGMTMALRLVQQQRNEAKRD